MNLNFKKPLHDFFIFQCDYLFSSLFDTYIQQDPIFSSAHDLNATGLMFLVPNKTLIRFY